MQRIALLAIVLALLLAGCPALASTPGPGCGYVDVWLVPPRPYISGTFDVYVMVSPHGPNAAAQLREVDVYLDWDPRYVTLCGTVYQPAATWSRGPDLPASWSGTWPLRDGTNTNSNWAGGNARLRLRTYVVCPPTLRVDRPLWMATIHFKTLRPAAVATYVEIDYPFYTMALGRWDADPCHHDDRAAQRQGCWLNLRGLSPSSLRPSVPASLGDDVPVPVFDLSADYADEPEWQYESAESAQSADELFLDSTSTTNS